MHKAFRTAIFGLVAGFLLCAMRAPLGLDLTQVPAVEANTSAIFRAAALFALVLALDPTRAAFRGGVATSVLLLSACAGLLLHAVLGAMLWEPASRLEFSVLLVVGTLLLLVLAGARSQPGAAEEEETPRPSLRERLGLVIAGAGAAITIEHLVGYVRMVGMRLPEEDSLIGAALLLLLCIGSVCFGAPLARGGWGRFATIAGVSLGAAATHVGLRFIGGLGHDPLYRYLKRFDLDYTMIGMAQTTTVLAAAALTVSAFLCGAALAGARDARRVASLVLGAAIGVLLLPHLTRALAEPLIAGEIFESTWAWKLFALGTSCAALGACLAALSAPGRQRTLGIGAALLAAALPWILPRPAVWPISPWYPAPIEPVLAVPGPAGLLTVEPERGPVLVTTLDRRRVSPTWDEEATDARRIAYAWSLLDPELREAGDARVLIVGQLTPARVRVLESLGEMRLERTAAWHEHMPLVEKVLFQDEPLPRGEPLTPAQARRRLSSGEYDLVLVMPIHGPVLFPKTAAHIEWGCPPAPRMRGWEVPEETIAVAWIDASAPSVHRSWPDNVILATDRFLHLSLGLVEGSVSPGDLPERPALFPSGEPRARMRPDRLLLRHPALRNDVLRKAVLERLMEASRGGPLADLALGLEIHYSAQKHSSPYETLAQQIELELDELSAFDRAVRATSPAPLDAFTRSIWESLAWLLAEKRMIDMVVTYVEPVADAYAPWPELDRAVARAYAEYDEPEGVLRILERMLEAEPNDITMLVEAGHWASRVGEHQRAIAYLRKAEGLQPGRPDLRRALGIALLRAGEPEGREILEELLEQAPQDEELWDLLREGPGTPEGG
jgi:hypothetical protein